MKRTDRVFFLYVYVNKVLQVLAKLIKPKRERKYINTSNEKAVIKIEDI